MHSIESFHSVHWLLISEIHSICSIELNFVVSFYCCLLKSILFILFSVVPPVVVSSIIYTQFYFLLFDLCCVDDMLFNP